MKIGNFLDDLEQGKIPVQLAVLTVPFERGLVVAQGLYTDPIWNLRPSVDPLVAIYQNSLIPTAEEVTVLIAAMEQRLVNYWRREADSLWQARSANTVILNKVGDNDWQYRRSNWDMTTFWPFDDPYSLPQGRQHLGLDKLLENYVYKQLTAG